MNAKRDGFTLLELLLVVAIIAILIAMLIPSMSLYREKSKQLVCAKNLENLGIGIMAYLQDSEGKFPQRQVAGVNTMYSWYGTKGLRGYATIGADKRLLNSYLAKTSDADAVIQWTRCPNDDATYHNNTTSHYESSGTSYGANNPVPGRVGSGGFPVGIAMSGGVGEGRQYSMVKRPSTFVMMGEDGAFAATWWSQSVWDVFGERMFWHDPYKWNILFADGHVGYTTIRPQEWRGSDYSFDYRF